LINLLNVRTKKPRNQIGRLCPFYWLGLRKQNLGAKRSGCIDAKQY